MNTGLNLRVLVIFTIAFSLAAFPGIGLYHAGILLVRGDPAPSPPFVRALFVPSGPASDEIRYPVYTDPEAEFNALQAGQIDLTDTPLTPPFVAQFCPRGTSFFCTGPDAAFDMFQIDFNHANSFFGITDCFGQDNVMTGSQCTVPRGANPPGYPFTSATCPAIATPSNNCTQAMINFRQGVAHLLDKQAITASQFGEPAGSPFTGPLAQAIDNPLSPAQAQPHSGLPCDGLQQGLVGGSCPPLGTPTSTWRPYTSGGFALGGVCSWDSIDKAASVNCISAEHRAGDGTSTDGITVKVDTPDFVDAGAHWVTAGLATGQNPDGTLCEASPGKCYWSPAINSSSAGYKGPIIFVIRNDAPPRLVIGEALATKLCQLIGSPTVAPGSISTITGCPQVFKDSLNFAQLFCLVFCTNSAGGPSLGWHMYTGGFLLSEEYNQEWALYNGQFASDFCVASAPAVPAGSVVKNHVYFCNEKHDHFSQMVEENSTFAGATISLQVAMEIFGIHTATIPLYTLNQVFAYRQGWTGVSDADGAGIATGNPWTLLNAWNPSPVASGPTIRWGMAFGTSSLNPYLYSTVQEQNVLQEVYNTLLTIGPYTSSGALGGLPLILSWMANSYAFVTHAADPSCPSSVTRSSEPGAVFSVAECLKMSLRGDMIFHDGAQVTASDIKFSYESLNVTGGFDSAGTLNVRDVAYDPRILSEPIGQPENLYIALGSPSVFTLEELATVFILPQHTWHTIGATGPCVTEDTPGCQVDPSFLTTNPDPATLINRMLVGSGPFVCASGPLGAPGTVVGGGCTSSGSGSVSPSGTITLRRFGFGLTPTNLAYFRNNANYVQWQWANFDGAATVDATDISTVASCLSASSPLTGGCLHYDTPARALTSTFSAGPPIGQASGGDSDGLVTNTELTQAKRWFATSWTDPVAYGSLTGAQPVCSPGTSGADAGACNGLFDDGTTYSTPPPPP